MPTSLAPGSRFGGYEILAEIGAGGMGHVFRARDVTLDRLVALKTLTEEGAQNPNFVQRFLKEARAVARLNHPNIVQIYGFGAEGSVHYLAMELLDGKSLGFYLRTTRWPENEAVLILRQACQGLAAAHEAGLVHRDIKPENMILTSRGEIKLVDLGIAKQLGDDQSLTQTGSAMGTPHYIAPEQVRGERDIDGRADIYSLGATFYHLVTGRPPFSGTSAAHVMSMHLVEPMPDPRTIVPGLSEGLCRVLRKMMAKDRAERYASVRALDVDLYQLQTGGTPNPAEPSATMVGRLPGGLDPTVLDGPGMGPYGAGASGGGTGYGGGAPSILDPSVVGRVEEHLTHAIGPMAKVLVKKAARSAHTVELLYQDLAAQIPPGPEREAFVRRCVQMTAASGSGERTPGGGTSTRMPSTPGHGTSVASGPMPTFATDAELARVESELARRIGPLAKVLVRKTAKKSVSLEDLVRQLEGQIPDPSERPAFRKALLGRG